MQHEYQLAQVNAQISGDPVESISADQLANIYVKNYYSEERKDMLAAIWEHPGFLDVFDHFEVWKKKKLLKRRQETIFRGIDLHTRLFQKTYYHPKLTVTEQKQLSDIFKAHSSIHDRNSTVLKLATGLGLIPILYFVGQRVRPINLIPVSLVYLGIYFYGEKSLLVNLQRSLNKEAEPFALNLNLFRESEQKQ